MLPEIRHRQRLWEHVRHFTSRSSHTRETPMSLFVYLFRATASEAATAMSPERAQQSVQAMLAWFQHLEAQGHLKSRGQPLAPSGAVVRGRNAVVTDGPYAEAKDMVLGFIVVEATDLAQAAELARTCPIVLGGGAIEIRPVGQRVGPEDTKE